MAILDVLDNAVSFSVASQSGKISVFDYVLKRRFFIERIKSLANPDFKVGVKCLGATASCLSVCDKTKMTFWRRRCSKSSLARAYWFRTFAIFDAFRERSCLTAVWRGKNLYAKPSWRTTIVFQKIFFFSLLSVRLLLKQSSQSHMKLQIMSQI